MSDEGHAAVELAMGVAVLLLPVALAITAFGPWSERRVLAEAVAAESARATVLQLDHTAGAAVARDIVAGHGLAQDQALLGWCGVSPAPLSSPSGLCSLGRGDVVQVVVEIWAPLIVTPWGPVGGLWVHGEHAEPIDLYRSLP